MARNGRARERGGARLKLVMAVAVLVGLIHVGWKIIPPYVNNYDLQDSMETEARFAAVNRKTEDDVRDAIFRRAKALGIPARREDIKVENVNGALTITVNYAVPIDLLGYSFELPFHPQVDNRTI